MMFRLGPLWVRNDPTRTGRSDRGALPKPMARRCQNTRFLEASSSPRDRSISPRLNMSIPGGSGRGADRVWCPTNTPYQPAVAALARYVRRRHLETLGKYSGQTAFCLHF
jgi:hypothetical protein